MLKQEASRAVGRSHEQKPEEVGDKVEAKTSGGGTDNRASIRRPVSLETGSPDSSEHSAKKRSIVRRSLPCYVDAPKLQFPERPMAYMEREIVSAGNSPAISPTGQLRDELETSDDECRPPPLLHAALPSLHLNARCLKCDRVGTVYCKGCEAHFCAKHDQRRHRFMLRKDGHEYEELPGISYFRIPLPNSEGTGLSPYSEVASEDSNITPRGSVVSSRSGMTASLEFDSDGVTALTTGGGGGGGAGGVGGYRGDRDTVAAVIAGNAAASDFPKTPAGTGRDYGGTLDSGVRAGAGVGAGAAIEGALGGGDAVAPRVGGGVGRGRRGGRGGLVREGGGPRPGGVGAGRGFGRGRALGSAKGGRGSFAKPAMPRGSSSRPETRRTASAIDLARSGWYDKIVMAIVRPPRCKYSEQDLGPELTPLGSGLTMMRRDFVVRNRRGLDVVCSQWRPSFAEDTSQLPCVVYLHGNSSARVDVVKTRSLTVLGAAACTVVAFDFSGSGMSGGDWVTLGYFEQHDVADVLAYLRSNDMANRYLLWGRSMGAASALLYAERYPNSDLCGLILDSPFCSFKRLAKDLVTQGQVNVPGFLVNGALGMLRRSVRKRTRCDLKTVAPIDRARLIQCPSLFIAARKDVMVHPSHGADLSDAVTGASLFITCRGTHNTSRPGVVLAAIGTFVKGCFRGPEVPITQAFEAIQVKLAEAQATAAALRAGRSSASSRNDNHMNNHGSKSNHPRGKSGDDGSEGTGSARFGQDKKGNRATADDGGGGTTAFTAEVKGGGGEAGMAAVSRRPPFAPGALAARALWKDPTNQERTSRASSFGGTEARPSSRAGSWELTESGGNSGTEHRQTRALSHREEKQTRYAAGRTSASLGDPVAAAGGGPNSAGREHRTDGSNAIKQVFPSRLPSWRDTIFDERPKRLASLDELYRGGTREMSSSPKTAAAAGSAASSTARITSTSKLAPASHAETNATQHKVDALSPPQTATSGMALTPQPREPVNGVMVSGVDAGKGSNANNRVLHGHSPGSSSPTHTTPQPTNPSAKTRAKAKALEMAERGKGGGRGTRKLYQRPFPTQRYLATNSASTADPSTNSTNAATTETKTGSRLHEKQQQEAREPPPANAVHLALGGAQPKPSGVCRPGSKVTLEFSANETDFLEEVGHERVDGQRGGGGGGGFVVGGGEGAHVETPTQDRPNRRWAASGPVRSSNFHVETGNSCTANGDAAGGASDIVRRSGPVGGATLMGAPRRMVVAASTTVDDPTAVKTGRNWRGRSRGGVAVTGAGAGRWWDRLQVKAPGLHVFRKGARGNGGLSGDGPVSGFTSIAGSGGGSAASARSARCATCGNSSTACMCGIFVPIVNDGGGPSRRPSAFRTESGKLKM